MEQKTLNNKTFANFKTHMRTSYHALNEVGALTIEDSSINQANLIQELSLQKETLTQDINDTLQSNILDAMKMMSNTPLLIKYTSSISSNTINTAKSSAIINLKTGKEWKR